MIRLPSRAELERKKSQTIIGVTAAQLLDLYDQIDKARTPEAPATARHELPCGECPHMLRRHIAQPEGACLDCGCIGWVPKQDGAVGERGTPTTALDR